MISSERCGLLLVVVATLLAGMLTSGQALAQQWSPEQQEVWQVVVEYNERYSQKDVEGFFSHIHPNYIGWYTGYVHPTSRDTEHKIMSAYFERPWRIAASEVQPAAIQVFDDTAIVHYFYSGLYEDDGELEMEQERWTDVLKRENGRWLVIGSHGGPVKINE